MAPAKTSRTTHDECQSSDVASLKDRNGNGGVTGHYGAGAALGGGAGGGAGGATEAGGSTKMRRGASQMANNTAQHQREAATTVPSVEPTLNWSNFDRDTLHTYSSRHRLNTPSSFVQTYHQLVLSQPNSIGLYSPTMARASSATRQARSVRQSKEQLAMVVRKHFNAMGVQENDVIVDLIYKLRSDATHSRQNGPKRQPTSLNN